MTVSPKKDRWIKCIAQMGNLHATAMTGVDLIRDACGRHKVTGDDAKHLGEGLLAALLLASTCKNGERTSLSIKGDKRYKQLVADARPEGSVRGFITTRSEYDANDESLGPWQNGMVSVVRQKLYEKEPYVGTVPTATGYLAKDLTYYLLQSEQLPSAVGIAVNTDKSGKVTSAGAFLVQVMPGATDEEIKLLEKNISEMDKLAEQVSKNSDPTLLLTQIFGDMSFMILEEKELKFECQCSREKVVNAIRLTGKTEIESMISDDKGTQVHCDFCGKEFNFSESDLRSLID